MFLLRSPPPEPPGPALTASQTLTQDQAQRRARHLRQCERLAELGMELVEIAHREAVNDMRRHPERRPSPFHGVPDLPPAFTLRDSTYGQLFAQLSRCVRQAILLEARLAAGAYDHPDPAPDRAPRAEPPLASPQPHRRPDDRPRLRPEPLEDDLAADAARPIPEILAGIRAELGAATQAPAPDAPTPDAPTPAAGSLDRPPRQPHRPPPGPPPVSQAERSVRLAARHGIPPPTASP